MSADSSTSGRKQRLHRIKRNRLTDKENGSSLTNYDSLSSYLSPDVAARVAKVCNWKLFKPLSLNFLPVNLQTQQDFKEIFKVAPVEPPPTSDYGQELAVLEKEIVCSYSHNYPLLYAILLMCFDLG